MKPNSLSVLYVLVLCCALFSCHKGNDNPVTPPPVVPPPTVSGTMDINLSTARAYGELIFKEPGGKTLLDTLGPFQEPFITTLKTDQKVIDLAFLRYDTSQAMYIATLYKGVNPSASSWTSLSQAINYRAIGSGGLTSTPASIFYTNRPNVSLNGLALSNYIGFNNSYSFPTATTMLVNYQQYSQKNYVFLIMPEAGLCNFYLPKGVKDTADLSKMDTLVKVNFQKPTANTKLMTSVYGVMDTTDLSKNLLIYSGVNTPGLPDAVYPRTPLVQKLDMQTSVFNSGETKFYASYYSYGNSISPNLPMPDSNYYTLPSTTWNSFSIQFNAARPLYVQTEWASPRFDLRIYMAADTVNLDAQYQLGLLSSKLLKGQDLGSIALKSLSFETIAGMNYADLMSFTHSPAVIKAKRVSSAMYYSKGF